MGYIRVITYLLTIDPNFQRDIQVGKMAIRAAHECSSRFAPVSFQKVYSPEN